MFNGWRLWRGSYPRGLGAFIDQERSLTVPDGLPVQIFACRYATDRFDPAAIAALPFQPPHLNGAPSRARQAEFIAGRYLAHRALSALGAAETVVPGAPRQAPAWPSGFRGSISHCAPHAVCAAARQSDIAFLGIDIETPMRAKTCKQIRHQVIDDGELACARQAGIEANLATAMAFSAKECLFKALHAHIPSDLSPRYGFFSARMVSVARDHGTLSLALARDLSPELRTGQTFTCHLLSHDGCLLALVAELHPV